MNLYVVKQNCNLHNTDSCGGAYTASITEDKLNNTKHQTLFDILNSYTKCLNDDDYFYTSLLRSQ